MTQQTEFLQEYTPISVERMEAISDRVDSLVGVDRTTLAVNEPHPSVKIARALLQKKVTEGLDLLVWREAFASCAIEGNRAAEVCLGTVNRLLNSEPISDRYFMGLVFAIIGRDLLE